MTTALSTKCSALDPHYLPFLTALPSPCGSSYHQRDCKQVPPQPKGQTCGSYKAETGPLLSASLEQVDQMSRNDGNPSLPTTNPATIPGPGHPDLAHSPQVGRPARPRGGTEGCPGPVTTRKGPAAAVQGWQAPQGEGLSAVGPPEPGGLLGVSGLRPPDASSIAADPPPAAAATHNSPDVTKRLLGSRNAPKPQPLKH